MVRETEIFFNVYCDFTFFENYIGHKINSDKVIRLYVACLVTADLSGCSEFSRSCPRIHKNLFV